MFDAEFRARACELAVASSKPACRLLPILGFRTLRCTALFRGGCECGAYVEMDVTTTQTFRELYDFYAKRAAATGWNVSPGNLPNFVTSWNKKYPNGHHAALSISLQVPTKNSYILNVSQCGPIPAPKPTVCTGDRPAPPRCP